MKNIPLLLLLFVLPHANAQLTDSLLNRSSAEQARPNQQPNAKGAAEHIELGSVRAFHAVPNGVEIRSENGSLRIDALEESIVRVRATRGAEFAPRHSYAVLPPASKTQENQNPSRSEPTAREAADSIEFDTPALHVRVDRANSAISILSAAGVPISRDVIPISWRGEEFTITKSMPEDEHYFGLGDKAGPLDHRNQAFTMWNTDAYAWQESTDPLYKTIPFLVGLRKGVSYGVLFDNTYREHWEFGKRAADQYSFGAEGGEADYYFIYGPSPKRVVEAFTALVGRTPLPPLWSLGFQQSRYSYYPEARAREIVNTYRQKKIPLDVIYLDIDYQRENRPFTVDTQRFPNFSGMIHDFAGQGVRTVLITDLHIKREPGYAPYDSGKAGDFFVKNPDGTEFVGPVWPGPSVFPDFTRKAARDWWGGLYKEFVDDGVAGFWNDMNEPSVFERADKTIPVDVIDRVEEPGEPPRTTNQREIHNVFGMLNSEGTYEGLLKLRPDVRPFVLTRATYAGGHRFAASWTGDNSSTWNHMRISVPMLENLGISGFALIGDDIGGYAGSPQPDLLTKWIELGTFNPIDRDHTEKGSANQEPWVHGATHDAIRKRYIEERYRLMPYIYTSVEQMTHDGVPVMRPLFLEYPEQEALITDVHWKDSEYLFGRDLLVAPAPYEFEQSYPVQLPQGSLWYDYWTGKQVQPGHIDINPTLDTLPVFVRGGAIVPRQPLVQNTGEKPQGPLELRVYPDRSCQGALYMDDGVSFNYSKGDYLRVDYSCEGYEDALKVKVSPQKGSYKPWFDRIQAVIYGVRQQPDKIELDGKPISASSYDRNAQTLTLTFPNAPQGAELRLSCGNVQKPNMCFALAQGDQKP